MSRVRLVAVRLTSVTEIVEVIRSARSSPFSLGAIATAETSFRQ